MMCRQFRGEGAFDVQQKLSFPQKLENYFKIIFGYIKSNNKNIQNEFKDNMNQIKEIIFDFVMDRIYDKIFPSEVNKVDNKILQNSIKLSSVKPNYFLGDKKQYVFGNFINNYNYYLKQLASEKSIRKKLINLDQIMNNISFFFKFNDKNIKDIGVDDIIPLLTFAMIKAQPSNISSNINYMKMYSKLGNFFVGDNKFAIFESAMKIIVDFKDENL